MVVVVGVDMVVVVMVVVDTSVFPLVVVVASGGSLLQGYVPAQQLPVPGM